MLRREAVEWQCQQGVWQKDLEVPSPPMQLGSPRKLLVNFMERKLKMQAGAIPHAQCQSFFLGTKTLKTVKGFAHRKL
jgi:hypothetical protein